MTETLGYTYMNDLVTYWTTDKFTDVPQAIKV